MKTQLLEDIGENTTSSLAPPGTGGNAKAGEEAQQAAPAGNAPPARPRSAAGVWRQKPTAEPAASSAHTEEPAPLELNKVFEEIAALEAQFVPPGEEPAPTVAASEPRHAPAAAPAEPLRPAAGSPAGAAPGFTPGLPPAQAAAAPQEPRFDFTPPGTAPQAASPFTPAGTGPARTGQRFLLWGACAVAGALLVLGGRWFYQEHNDARSLALIADKAKGAPGGDRAAQREVEQEVEQEVQRESKLGAPAATGATLAPDGGIEARPAMASPRPSAPPPPLVMLEPDPPAARAEAPSPPAAGQAAPPTAPRPESAAKRKTVPPSAKPSGRMARAPSGAAAGPAKEGARRAPARQLARASAGATESPSGPDGSMTATLKACREHGYHATQCIKQQCSVTQYGFACRGPG